MQKNKGVFGTRLNSPNSWADTLAVTIVISSLIFWSYTLFYKYKFFGYDDWDLAMYSQVMWNLSQGSQYSSLFETNFLTNHAEYIAFLLAPLYRIIPHPLLLIGLKIISFCLGAGILYLIARRLVSQPFAVVIMLLYLLYPPNLFMMIYEFHFENLAIIPIFLLYYAMTTDRLKLFIITAFTACLIKENICLIVAMFGIYAFFTKPAYRNRWGIAFILSLVIFCLGMFVLIPMLRLEYNLPGANNYIGGYYRLGASPAEILATILLNPVKLFRILTSPENLSYLYHHFSMTHIFSILSPHTLALGLPIFLQHMLSTSHTMHLLGYHYSGTIAPFIFLSAMTTFAYFQKAFQKRTVFILSALLIFSFGVKSSIYWPELLSDAAGWKDSRDPVRHAFLQKIPKDASIVTTFNFLPELSNRKHLYSLHTVWRGQQPFTGQRGYRIPDHVSFALIDWSDPYLYLDIATEEFGKPREIAERLSHFYFSGDWRVTAADGNLALMQKNAMGNEKLLEILSTRSPDQDNTDFLLIDRNIKLAVDDLTNNCTSMRSSCRLTFYWSLSTPTDTVYQMTLNLNHKGYQKFSLTRLIGYGIFPPAAWKSEETLKENLWLNLSSLPSGEYEMSLEVESIDGTPATIQTHGNAGMINENNVLGTLRI